MNLREIFNTEFGIDLPINGGLGNSMENAVIMELTNPMNDYVGTEYEILKYIGILRGIKWKMIKQELMFHNDRTYDKIQIETVIVSPTEVITQLENFYFDITACFGNNKPVNIQTDEDKKLSEMKRFLDTLNNEIDKEQSIG